MSELNGNQLIHKIKEYIPDEKIQFKKHEGKLQIVFINKKTILTILNCNTWEEIKNNIDEKMKNKQNDECSICSIQEKQKQKIKCSKCKSEWCVLCYVNIFKSNNGLIKCPFCQFVYGEEFPENLIEIAVKQIFEKSKLLNEKTV